MFQSVWIWDAFALIGNVCVWPDNKALFFWPPTRFQSAWILGGLRSDWPRLPGEGGAASAHLAGPAHWSGWLCCDLATKCCCFSDHPSGSSLCGYVEPLLSSADTVFDQTTKHCYHLPGSSLCGYREQSIVIICQVPVCVDTGNKALLLSTRFQSVWIQGTKHCYCLPGSSLCGYREQSIVVYQVPVCVDTGNKALLLSTRFQSVWIQGTKHCCLPGSSLCGYREQSIVVYQVPVCVDTGNKALLLSARFQSVWIQGTKHCYCLPGSSLCGYGEPLLWLAANCVLTWQQSAIVFLIMHHVSVFVDMGRICPNPPQLCFDLTTKHCHFSDHSPKFQSLWMLGAFVLICRSDNKALFFWSPTRFQSVWIWGAFALIGHACVWPDNKSIVFLITHQVPVCVDMGGLCSDWPCLCLIWQPTKALFFWSPTRFQSVWIWGAFALIGHNCVWPDNKSIVFLITHQVPVCVDMGGLCSDWPQLCLTWQQKHCFSDHPPGSSLCGYGGPLLWLAMPVFDLTTKALFFWSPTRFQSVWIWGAFALIGHACVWPDNKSIVFLITHQVPVCVDMGGLCSDWPCLCLTWQQKHCFSDHPPGSSLCGYGGPLLWLAMPVFDLTTKALFFWSPTRFQSVWIWGAFALIGHACVWPDNKSIVFLITHQVPVCVDMGGLCSDWPQLCLTWQQKHCFSDHPPGSSLCGYGGPSL